MFSMSKRATAAGVAGVVATGALGAVAVTGPATAAGVTTTYTCEVPLLGAVDLPVTAVADLPAQLPAGVPVPAVPVQMAVDLPASLLGALSFLGVTSVGGTVSEAVLSFGRTPVPLQGLEAAVTQLPAAGNLNLPVVGRTSPFTTPVAGSYPVTLPKSFTFDPVNQTGGSVVGAFPCALKTGAPSKVGTVQVSDQAVAKVASVTRARLVNAPVTVGERAKVAVTVRRDGQAAAGKVVARKGKKVVARGTLTARGKVRLVLPTLRRGEHKVVVRYAGNATTKASRKVLTFRVTR